MENHRPVPYNDIKARVSVIQVLEHYGLASQLVEEEGSYFGPCPIHHGKKLVEFTVDLSIGYWRCTTCQQGGNIFDIVRILENCNIEQAAVKIMEWFPEPPNSKPK